MKVRKFKSEYCGIIYDNEGKAFDRFTCREELLDFRLQVVAEQAVGYYVIFDNDEDKTICLLDTYGGIENHPTLNDPTHRICVEINHIRQNDISKTYDYREFY